MTRVVVCIVGFRNPDDIDACLAALDGSTHGDFEVVICENGGVEAHALFTQRLTSRPSSNAPVEILPEEGNSGYAGGNNRCVMARRDAALWWILNPDTRVASDAMARLVSHLEAGQSDAVGGTLLRGDGCVQAYGGRWIPLLARAISIGNGGSYNPATPIAAGSVDYLVGASLMFTRHFLAVAGPMREDYFLYGEEVEWCLRAKARGLRLGVVPDAVIHHAQGTTTGDGGQFRLKPKLPVFLDQRNKVLVLRDTSPGLLIPGAIGSLLALTMRAMKNRAWRQFGYGVRGWAAGLANRRGIPTWLQS